MEDEETLFEFIVGGADAAIGDFVLEDQAKISSRKRKKPYMMNNKPMYYMSYYQWSYRKIKQVNMRLNRRNEKLKESSAQVRERMRMYKCREGLDSILQVVDQVDQLLSSSLPNDNNSNEE